MAKETEQPAWNLTDFRPSPLAGRLPFELKLLYLEVCGRATLPSTVRTLRDFWESILVDGLLRRLLERFRDLEIEAYRQERSQQSLHRWFAEEEDRLWRAYAEDAKSSGDRIGATRRCLSALQALTLPEHFRGWYKSPRPSALPSPDVLRQEYDDLVNRWRKGVSRNRQKVLDVFPDVSPAVLVDEVDRPGRCDPKRFAKKHLAELYGCSVGEVEKHLRKDKPTKTTPLF